jgi:hypothetical protein
MPAPTALPFPRLHPFVGLDVPVAPSFPSGDVWRSAVPDLGALRGRRDAPTPTLSSAAAVDRFAAGLAARGIRKGGLLPGSPRQLRRVPHRLVRVLAPRRGGGDHQHQVVSRRTRVLRREQRGRGGTHPARLRGSRGRERSEAPLHRDDGTRSGCGSVSVRDPRRRALRGHRRGSRRPAHRVPRSAALQQRAVHLGHHRAAKGCRLDARERSVGARATVRRT